VVTRIVAQHKNLASLFTFFVSSGEGSYTLFNGCNSKTFNGGLEHRRFVPRSIKHFDNGDDRCVCVQNFQAVYLSMIPPSGPFYRKPLASSFRFGAQCVGINTLSVYTKTMFTEAEIDTGDRRIVNHSGRVTCCIMLVLTSRVTDRRGHRSNAVQIYIRPCVEQQKAVIVSSALDVPDIASTSVGACVLSEDGKVKTHVANDVPANASSDNCFRIVLRQVSSLMSCCEGWQGN